jgi:intein-like protein with splicing domain
MARTIAMPPKRSPKAAPEAQQPINTYGYALLPGKLQVHYDITAFARRRSIDFGVPTRLKLFRSISDKMLPNHFEWHDWTERIVGSMCEYSILGFPGCSNCVSGDTRILDGITGIQPTIRFLCENGIAPIVMTLSGPVQAEVPYVKGVDEMFEITLENGSKFSATRQHRVLVSSANANHWFHVSDLQTGQYLSAYEPNRRQSISERDLSVRGQDVRGFQRKAEDLTQDYCPYSYPDDGRPLKEVGNDPIRFPSSACAPKHIQKTCNGGDSGDRDKRTHVSLPPFHPSTAGFAHRRNSFYIPELYRSHQGIPLHVFRSFEQRARFRLGTHFQPPFLEPVQNFSGSESLSDALLQSDKISSCGYRVSQSRIVSIRNTGKRTYYDISVPGPEHYFAEGTIHHNSAKTFNVVSFACDWWLCNPQDSSVTLVSTSKQSLRRRGWAEVSKCYTSTPGARFGNFIDSRMIWQAQKGDDKHAIIGKAVEEGPTNKVADDIKGVHTRRQMVIIDEATSVPAAIYEACANLYSYPEEFVLVLIGNPLNRLDQFGRFCEPDGGWNAVNVETGEWDGKPQESLGGRRPHIVTFDAEKSPNIVEGKIVSKHLPNKEKVEAARRNSGGGQSPLYWQNFRGFWPPEGLTKTVFTQSVLEKNGCYGKHQFTGRNFIIIGALDPARTGDRPALRFGKLGEIVGGHWGIEWFPAIIIPLDSSSDNQLFYQLCEQVKRQCESFKVNGVEYSCDPENFGIDATGSGSGCADILQRIWSPKVIRIEWGGSASTDPMSLENPRPANECVENKRVEMFFRTRDCANSGQLKGVDRETAVELCSLEFDESGKRMKLMSKDDYKEKFRMGSPDLADCAVELTEVARLKGFRLAPVGETIKRFDDLDKNIGKTQEIFHDAETYQPEEDYDLVEEM